MDADLDTLCTAVYVTADDLLPIRPEKCRRRVTDAELVTLAVAQAVMGIPSDRRFLAVARMRLRHLFPPPPRPVRLPQALPAPVRDDRLAGRGLRREKPGPRRRPGAAGLHPGRVRPLAPDRAPLSAGRLGRLRLVPQPLALFLGHAPAPGLRPGRHAAGGRAVPGRSPGARGGPRSPAPDLARRRDGGGRQGLCRTGLSRRRGRAGRAPGAPACAPTSPATGPFWGSSASAWSRSSRPSRTCSRSSATAPAPPRASVAASAPGCWPSPPAFGSTTSSAALSSSPGRLRRLSSWNQSFLSPFPVSPAQLCRPWPAPSSHASPVGRRPPASSSPTDLAKRSSGSSSVGTKIAVLAIGTRLVDLSAVPAKVRHGISTGWISPQEPQGRTKRGAPSRRSTPCSANARAESLRKTLGKLGRR